MIFRNFLVVKWSLENFSKLERIGNPFRQRGSEWIFIWHVSETWRKIKSETHQLVMNFHNSICEIKSKTKVITCLYNSTWKPSRSFPIIFLATKCHYTGAYFAKIYWLDCLTFSFDNCQQKWKCIKIKTKTKRVFCQYFSSKWIKFEFRLKRKTCAYCEPKMPDSGRTRRRIFWKLLSQYALEWFVKYLS